MFDADKIRMIGLPYGEKTMTIYLSVTDRRTDVSMLTRNKNVHILSSSCHLVPNLLLCTISSKSDGFFYRATYA